jgi:hypothetical protein
MTEAVFISGKCGNCWWQDEQGKNFRPGKVCFQNNFYQVQNPVFAWIMLKPVYSVGNP